MKLSHVIGIVFGVLFLASVIGYYLLVSSPTVAAQLYVEKGEVMVNGKAVIGKAMLKLEDTVECKGLATIILYESVVVNLDPGTMIKIAELSADHPKLIQAGGKTWNTFTKLMGVGGYTIKEGNTVATVRSTAFEFSEDKIIVGEGKVAYRMGDKEGVAAEGKVVEMVDGEVEVRDIDEEEILSEREKMKRAVEGLRLVRQEELDKHPIMLASVKQMYDMDDDDISEGLAKADEGAYDIDSTKEKVPLKMESVDKVADFTKKIAELNKGLDEADD